MEREWGGVALQSALDLLLTLLAAPGASGKRNEPVRDSTRLVKLLFLLIREGGFDRFAEEFGFKKDYAHDFGPWSGQVYDYAETLKQIGMISTQDVAKAETEEGIDDIEWARQFADPSIRVAGTVTVYKLTENGLKIAGKIFDSLPEDDKKKVIRIKSMFNSWPLAQLLEYVYRRYPEAITKSKIRERVLTKSMFGISPEMPKFKRDEEDFRDIE